MDNGSESSGVRTPFLHRMVQFVDTIGKPIHLLYYPPYHSKYNPIERCWGMMELHWNGAQLIDVETMLEWAKRMTWKGLHPVVELSRKVYDKRRVAEQGGDAGGGSTLGTQSAFAQMGHIDSPGWSRLSRDIHFEKSPKDV